VIITELVASQRCAPPNRFGMPFELMSLIVTEAKACGQINQFGIITAKSAACACEGLKPPTETFVEELVGHG
jgi:hypothetical protein